MERDLNHKFMIICGVYRLHQMDGINKQKIVFWFISLFAHFQKNISKLKIQWKIEWNQMKINTDHTNNFGIEGNNNWAWSKNILSFNRFKEHNLNGFEFELCIDILEIYNNNNKKINFTNWNNYIKKNKNINEFEEKK
eukprot:548229_1